MLDGGFFVVEDVRRILQQHVNGHHNWQDCCGGLSLSSLGAAKSKYKNHDQTEEAPVMSYVYLKNFALFIVSPTGFSLILLLVGLFFLWRKTNSKAGKLLVTCGCLYLLLGSLPFLPDFLLENIERHYAPYAVGDSGNDDFSDVKFVVVLAAGYSPDQELPITSRFHYEGLVRMVEGVRLHRIIPETGLILSGGRGEAESMKELVVALGVSQESLILETESMSTFDQARFIQAIVGEKRFLLVTSARHMLRSMALFEKMGMSPIAAPTGHFVKHYGDGISLLPATSNLRKADTFFYEILALIKEKLMSRT